MAASAAALKAAQNEVATTATHLGRETAGSGELRASLASAQAKADRADHDKAEALAALRASQSLAADKSAKLDDAEKRMATRTTVEKERSSQSSGSMAQTLLSFGADTHVIFHHSSSGDIEKALITTMRSKLRGLNADIVYSSDAPRIASRPRVTYYYKQDQAVANSVAERMQAAVARRVEIRTTKLPRPGTIEVLLGG